jgi:hypothetical protein
MLLRTLAFILFLLVQSILLPNIAYANALPSIPIAIEKDVYQDYLCFLNGRNVLSIEDYRGRCSRRDVIEIVLIQQMLFIGGFHNPLKFEPGIYNLRSRKMLETGLLLANFDSVWLSEAKKLNSYVYTSPPVIRKGEYFAGVYVLTRKLEDYSNLSTRQLKSLKFTSSKHWGTDWRTLANLGIENVYHEGLWLAQINMLENGFVDAMLAPFPDTENLEYQVNGVELAPIRNVKILLDDSRHILFSKNHKKGSAAYEAFKKGMTTMRKRGQIVRAYKESGFFNDRVRTWKVFN